MRNQPSLSRAPAPPRRRSDSEDSPVTVADAAWLMGHLWAAFTWAFPLFLGLAFVAQPSFALGFVAVLSVPVWAFVTLYRLGGPSTLDGLRALDGQQLLGLIRDGLRIRQARLNWSRALTRLQLVDENGRPLTRPSAVKVTDHGFAYRVPLARDSDLRIYEDMAGSLRRVLGARDLTVSSSQPGVMDVRGRYFDILSSGFTLPEFALQLRDDQNTGSTSDRAYVALNADGQPTGMEFTHTLVVGASGAGKGSVLWSLYAAYRRGIEDHTVKVWGIDPKNFEFKGMNGAFDRLAIMPEDRAKLLVDLEQERQDREARSSGRKFHQSPDNPALICFVDEYANLFNGMDKQTKADALAAFGALMSMGRSAGIMLVLATQQGTKEIVGPQRDNIGQVVCLRVKDATATRVVLGDSADDEGHRPDLIEPATESNGYRTAGRGFIQSSEGTREVRFPYASDDDLAAMNGSGR